MFEYASFRQEFQFLFCIKDLELVFLQLQIFLIKQDNNYGFPDQNDHSFILIHKQNRAKRYDSNILTNYA